MVKCCLEIDGISRDYYVAVTYPLEVPKILKIPMLVFLPPYLVTSLGSFQTPSNYSYLNPLPIPKQTKKKRQPPLLLTAKGLNGPSRTPGWNDVGRLGGIQELHPSASETRQGKHLHGDAKPERVFPTLGNQKRDPF